MAIPTHKSVIGVFQDGKLLARYDDTLLGHLRLSQWMQEQCPPEYELLVEKGSYQVCVRFAKMYEVEDLHLKIMTVVAK